MFDRQRGVILAVILFPLLFSDVSSQSTELQPTIPAVVKHAAPPGSFWNTHSGRFIYPPAFAVANREGVDLYQFTIRSLTNGSATTFFAPSPSSSLAPVWVDLPSDSLLLLIGGLE